MKTDIEIATAAVLSPITAIGEKLGLESADLEAYGPYKAKISWQAITHAKDKPETGKLILVTAINPTPAGEGKSTVTIGLGDALQRLGKKVSIALREPSLGPVMGLKGGAAGGGYAQVVPMADINLHFTGDMHAITAAHNTLSALIDNHIHQGNALSIDPEAIVWKRVLDINDRSLRQVMVGLGGPINGVPRQDGFDITVASEIMAVLCLATDLPDLKERLSHMLIAYDTSGHPLYVRDLGVQGALALLLKDALKPNLVQTLEGTPAFIHGGPFANIAHGCNAVLATKTALSLSDYVVTEAGFGADLGAEKFLDIKVPHLKVAPSAVVLVATIRALKMHGGHDQQALDQEDIPALAAGLANLKRHIANLQKAGLPVVVAVNRFQTDTEAEVAYLQDACHECGTKVALVEVWEKGGQGGQALAQEVLDVIESDTAAMRPYYSAQQSLEDKVKALACGLYGAKEVVWTDEAKADIVGLRDNGWDKLPICMAKTPASFSDDPTLVGAPSDFTVTISALVPKLGAGFIVVMTGKMLTMPGLPKYPAALRLDVTKDGQAIGLS